MSDPVTVVTVATAVVCALVGGAFFAFSNWVMDALARRPNREGIAAMQVINVTVINPTFMAALFGVVLPCVGLAVWAVASLGNGAGAGWVLAGSLVYTVGCAGLIRRTHRASTCENGAMPTESKARRTRKAILEVTAARRPDWGS